MELRPTSATVTTPASNVYLTPVFGGDDVSPPVVGPIATRDGRTVRPYAGESAWTPAGEGHGHGGTAEILAANAEA